MPWSNDALRGTQYQEKARELINVINSLRENGTHFLLDLPTVCVCGNQSAGKSSVMEGLSGITLPRSPGTCTRCPMEVRLRSEGDFSCLLKLREEYTASGQRIDDVEEKMFGGVVRDASRVEDCIKRAQKAILNPGKPRETYIEYSFEEDDAAENELQFSKNVVVVEITGGPGDLTLIDLPGIIRNTEKEADQRYIGDIQELVRAYTAKDNTIIVATVTCSDDIDNQEVVKLAKEADPEMMRTLGVLTKPDRIDAGEELQWRAILDGTRYPLKLGWFMVKNPNHDELRAQISFKIARLNEKEFFRSHPALTVPNHVGTDQLRQTLSKQLVELIKRKLPGMMQQLQKHLNEAKAELKKLPAAVASPMVEFSNLASSMRDQLRAIVNATEACPPEDKAIYQAFIAKFAEFQRSVMQTQPVLRMNRFAFSFGNAWNYVLVACNAEGSDLVQAHSEEEADRLGLRQHAAMHSPLKIADVNAIIDKERGRELPGSTPYSALVGLVQQCQKNWGDLAESCFDDVASKLLDCGEEQAAASFERFPRMHMVVRSFLQDAFAELALQAKSKVLELADDEHSLPPFTLNDHHLQDSHLKFKGRLTRMWREQGSLALMGIDDYHIQASLTALHKVSGFSGVTSADMFRTLDLGKDAEAIDLMSKAMAYLTVSAKRFGDCVPMRISGALLQKFPAILYQRTLQILQQQEDGVTLEELMQEDAGVASSRTLLTNRVECLKAARSKLTLLV